MRIQWTAFLFLSILFFSASAQDLPLITPKKGLTITHSGRITPGVYQLSTEDDLALIQVSGENIQLDFTGVVLKGNTEDQRPDDFKGIAIKITPGSKNIRINNAHINGYKIAILADSVLNLSILQSDLSFNYRQQLKSNLDREDISDWMSYHKNDHNEWMRYGAGIYLRKCNNAKISGNTVTNGQCGLMMTLCDSVTVSDNNFSFNSGIGIGLYRSNDNMIYHNRVDWNVRGYSHGKYKRGQDSAGFLVFEQCNHNIFAFNSATHSGDGFFLWAGQHTMDTGEGGCNDNFIYGNDFSYAPTNGVEVTFSRNLIMKNIIRDCDHGIWGGYSYESDFTDNDFAFNRIGIAIEHGQNNNIALNRFLYDKTAIKLWSREKQPADWKYAQVRDTKSKNYWIAVNQFTATETVYDIMGTDTVAFSGNLKMAHTTGLKLGDRTMDIDTSREDDPLDMDYAPDERLKKIPVTKKPVSEFPKGKDQIRITTWGPYNFEYPLLWLKQIDSTGLYHFEVLAPDGHWRINGLTGFEITDKGVDSFPSYLIAKPITDNAFKEIKLEYAGDPFIDQFGKTGSNGAVFGYEQYLPKQQWNIKWFSWNEETDPLTKQDTFIASLSSEPIHQGEFNKLDFTWWGAIGKNLPADSFATVATTSIETEAGFYDIGITADDYVKVFVDGNLFIDAWDPKYTALDELTHHKRLLELSKGYHEFKIIHAERTGIATLMFYIHPQKKQEGKIMFQQKINDH